MREPAGAPAPPIQTELGTLAPAERATELAWSLLTSTATTVVLLAGLGVWWWVGAAVEQGALAADLMRRHAFPVVRAIEAFGLSEVILSWPSQLLALLLVANLSGRWLRARLAGARVRPSLATVLGALGAVATAAGLAVDGAAGERLRYEVIDASATPARVEAQESGRWVPTEAGAELSCGRADPQDPWRERICRATEAGSEPEDLVASAGSQTPPLPGRQLRAVSERPLFGVGLGPTPILMCTGSAAACRAGGPAWHAFSQAPGQRFRLGDGTEIAAFVGRDGPLVVVAPAGERPSLVGPALTRAAAPASGDRWFRGVPHWSVELVATRLPGRLVVWTGALVLVAGLLVWAGRVPWARPRWEANRTLRAGLALVGVALVACAVRGHLSGAPVMLGVAAIVCTGTPGAWALAALAATSAVGLEAAPPVWHESGLALAAGAGLGCLARATIEQAGSRGRLGAALTWAAASALVWLPDGVWYAADGAGSPMGWGLALQDPLTGARFGAAGQAVLAHPSHLQAVLSAARLAVPLAWLLTLAAPRERASRWKARAELAGGSCLVLLGVGSGLESLLGAPLGMFPTPDLAVEMGRISGGSAPAVGWSEPQEAFAAPGPRLVVDALRVLMGAVLAWLALRRTRAKTPLRASAAAPDRGHALIALAVALPLVGALLASQPGVALSLWASAWLAGAGLSAACASHDRAATALAAMGTAACLFGVLGPGLAWIPGS